MEEQISLTNIFSNICKWNIKIKSFNAAAMLVYNKPACAYGNIPLHLI